MKYFDIFSRRLVILLEVDILYTSIRQMTHKIVLLSYQDINHLGDKKVHAVVRCFFISIVVQFGQYNCNAI